MNIMIILPTWIRWMSKQVSYLLTFCALYRQGAISGIPLCSNKENKGNLSRDFT